MREGSTTTRRCADDDGAVVIEAALVLPLLMALLAGTIDFGVAFRSRTIIQGALRNSARSGAAAVNAPSADQLALSTFYAGLVPANGIELDSMIIFEANGRADGLPSPACLAVTPAPTGAGLAGQNCNVYTQSQVLAAASVPSTFVGSSTYLSGTVTSSACSNGWNRYWCAGGNDGANERTANLSGTVDSIGVYASTTYTSFTGIFGSEFTITDSAVMRLEPAPG